jgi:hypothetical protein
MLKIASLAKFTIFLIVENFAFLSSEVLREFSVSQKFLKTMGELASRFVRADFVLYEIFAKLNFQFIPGFTIQVGFIFTSGIRILTTDILVKACIFMVIVGIKIWFVFEEDICCH